MQILKLRIAQFAKFNAKSLVKMKGIWDMDDFNNVEDNAMVELVSGFHNRKGDIYL